MNNVQLLEIKKNKNNEPYLLVSYDNKNGKTRKKALSLSDITYCLKGAISYEIKTNNK